MGYIKHVSFMYSQEFFLLQWTESQSQEKNSLISGFAMKLFQKLILVSTH